MNVILKKPALQFRGRINADVILPLFFEKFHGNKQSVSQIKEYSHRTIDIIELV